MEIHEYLSTMIEIQEVFLKYIDSEDCIQENLDHFIKLLKDQKIINDKHKLTAVIKLISIITNYHYRTIDFFDKIFNVIIFLKDDIKKYYTNREILNLFPNKKVLLFLLREKIINLNKSIVSNYMINYQSIIYSLSDTGIYLYPEIKQYIDEKYTNDLEIPENLEELRETEYGDNHIIQLIQKDLIDEFITYVNTKQFDLNEEIKNSSIFETNILITQFEIQTAIEYATFFGSIKIFKYLFAQQCSLTSDLLLYAIHGRNSEIIHILEENEIETNEETYKKCFSLAIKCHHNELADYILNNYLKIEDISTIIFKKSLKNFNYSLIQPEKVNSDSFNEICFRDHYILAKYLLDKDKSIDINSSIKRKIKEKWTENQIQAENTALFTAISLGNTDIAELLLGKKDIDVNKKSFENNVNDNDKHKEITPLFIAALQRDCKIVSLLLEHKDIDVNMKSKYDKEEVAPINAAIESNDDEIVQMLLNHKDIDVNIISMKYDEDIDQCTSEFYREVTPLYQAAGFCDNPKIVQLLLNHKNIDINAIIKIREEQYISFTEKRFDPRDIEETALFAAIDNEKVENVRILLTQKNIDVKFRFRAYCQNKLIMEISMLKRAISNNNLDVLQLLLNDKRFDVNEKVPLRLCNDEDVWDEEKIKEKKLLHKKKQFKRSDMSTIYSTNDKISILHYALSFYQINTVKIQLLLGNENIDVNAYSFIKEYKHTLTSLGGENEQKKLEEKTPLYFAVERGNYEIVKLLVEHNNININKKSMIYMWQNIISTDKEEEERNEEEGKYEKGVKEIDKDETALHLAVAKGDISIIELLLSHKSVDVNITDKQGRKPIELTHKEEIISLFNQFT